MTDNQNDVVVLGGGPGGYVAAIRAAQLGLRTTLVESHHLGGICLNWGCIPTKALLRAAEVRETIANAAEFGFRVGSVETDFASVVKRSRKVAKKLSAGVSYLLKKNKVPVVEGRGRLEGKPGSWRVVVETSKGTRALPTANVILATGARARTIQGFEPDGKAVWTYREAMIPEAMPESLVVVGSGAIGIEFASFYRSMGASVHVLEAVDRILPAEDEEIAAFARKAMEAQGLAFRTGVTLKAIKRSSQGVEISFSATDKAGQAETIQAEKLIMAVGIVGNVENIGLEDAGVEVRGTHAVTGDGCATAAAGIYAIGDLAGPPWLAHKASHEGVLAAETIAGKAHGAARIDPKNIPACTYAHPQIASVGFTQKEAESLGHKVRVGRFALNGNGKAVALGDTAGLVKTLFDASTGELLGAHMVGPEVTEMIQGYAIARTAELTEADLFHTVFPHPTISEAMHESALDAYGRVIHL